MIRSPRKTAKFALALLFSASAGSIAVATPLSAQEQDNFQRYANSGYNYCDAKMMGAIYGEDAYQGKLLIGQKIANGIGSNIPLMLSNSRASGNSCSWADVPYTYEDAERLGNYWGVSTYDAKLKVARYFTNGDSGIVADALGNTDSHTNNDAESVRAFGRSGFTYCDAKLIGQLWNTDTWGGKIAIGYKVQNGLSQDIPYYLDQSRDQGNWCDWADTVYSYDDAVQLSRLWQTDVAQAKLSASKLVSWGRSDVVETLLGR